jgi:predicted unusual protein kinase regulating ubiquinone biosynthesis (AarF/ABC1/UbiB family)
MDYVQTKKAFLSTGFEFDLVDYTPINSGSIAQVHRAVYQGEEVAVKLQRVGKKQEVARDSWLFTACLEYISAKVGRGHSDALTSLHEVLNSVEEEFDFVKEASIMRQFREFYDGKGIIVPRVIDASDTCIIMEYLETEAFHQPSTVLMKMFFDQVFHLQLLHTDMHAGNVAQTRQGTPVLFDFGSVMAVKPELVLCIKHLMIAWLNRSPSVMVDYMLMFGMIIGSPSDKERLQLEEFIEHILEYVEHTDIHKFADGIKSISDLESPTIQFDQQLFMMMRTFTLLEGTCKTIDPKFTIIDAIMPLAEEMLQDPFMYRAKVEDDLRTLWNMFSDRA